jgi:UDP-N-acetylmuramoyl-L-alanyl-D-glutamate--2,6-diaminopimelate ligase
MVVIGVTGTDGKTTTTNLIYQVLLSAGIQAGMISTVNAVIGSQVLDTGFHVTTPDAPDIQRYLLQMANAGLTHAVLEVTSHGLDQGRVDACEFDAAVVTNITHEHLDYHGTYEAYRAAKGRLFTLLEQTRQKPFQIPRLAVLNRDDDSYEYLSGLVSARKTEYGLHPEARWRAEDVQYASSGLAYTAVGLEQRFPVKTQLVGSFNISNTLAAIALLVEGLGLSIPDIQRGLAGFTGVSGRMERIEIGQDFTAIVDFAHTPNALRRALETGRQLAGEGRLIVVFGSAGLRDRAKRRMMAQVAAEMADISIITAEDPRTEALEAILKEMATGAEDRGAVPDEGYRLIPDRGEAIRQAVGMARSGDLVIACGKGHEQSMCFGTVEYPWDDRTAMRAALAEKLGIPGPEMPRLPTSR